jgi:hypothetical protein
MLQAGRTSIINLIGENFDDAQLGDEPKSLKIRVGAAIANFGGQPIDD